MIRTAFLVLGSSKWWGGVTYLRNLLQALSQLPDKRIEPVVFAGLNTDEKILSMLRPYAELVQDSIFDMGGFSWAVSRVMYRIAGDDLALHRLLRRHDISVISHLQYAVRGKKDHSTVGWIPDFQHLHLPEMFSKNELAVRSSAYSKMAEKCDAIILSSCDALKDFSGFAPAFAHKGRVLHFVAQPDPQIYAADRKSLEDRFQSGTKYFYLPNQFWKHKNHKAAFEAVAILKDRLPDILLLCSGAMEDYRNREHAGNLLEYIRNRGLEKNIRTLGMIDSKDLFGLMRNCVSILNPSLFEGWSTTVEEAKSLGKNMILSDIPVHREQSPPESSYFNPRDPGELAEAMERKWRDSEGGPDAELEEQARRQLPIRTVEFAANYQKIIMDMRDEHAC